MVNSVEFAKRLQKVLDFYSLSATSFSEEVGVNRSTISHLLSGRNKPSLEFVMKVLQKFPEIELYWLLNGKGSFPPSPIKQESKSKPTVPELPFEETPDEIVKTEVKKSQNTGDIEKIIICYADGSFKVYEI